MKRYLLFPILLILFLAGTGCSSLQINPLAALDNCQFTFQRVTPTIGITFPLENSYVDLNFDIGVKNPNSVTLNFTRLAFDLYINDQYRVFTGTTDYGLSLRANEFSTVRLKSRFTYREFSDLFLTLADVIRKHQASYTIKGTAFYSTPFGEISFPTTIAHNEIKKG